VEPKVGIYSGNASRVLAESIAKSYGIPLGKTTYTKFADGEFQVSFDETIRGKEVFIVQSTFPPVDNLFELLLMIDAVDRVISFSLTFPYIAPGSLPPCPASNTTI
jgi:ribose-phosphate pyrophosphokinase